MTPCLIDLAFTLPPPHQPTEQAFAYADLAYAKAVGGQNTTALVGLQSAIEVMGVRDVDLVDPAFVATLAHTAYWLGRQDLVDWMVARQMAQVPEIADPVQRARGLYHLALTNLHLDRFAVAAQVAADLVALVRDDPVVLAADPWLWAYAVPLASGLGHAEAAHELWSVLTVMHEPADLIPAAPFLDWLTPAEAAPYIAAAQAFAVDPNDRETLWRVHDMPEIMTNLDRRETARRLIVDALAASADWSASERVSLIAYLAAGAARAKL